MSFKLAIVGAGLKAGEYVPSWLKSFDVSIEAIVDVNMASCEKLADICESEGQARPKLFAAVDEMIGDMHAGLDAVYIATPHAFHADQAEMVIDAGVNLLLEKPMATTVDEANRLLAAQEKSGSIVVIAFQGALSELVQRTEREIQEGKYGELISIAANIWEDWAERYATNWKQVPEISGGGFMFDTGAHMMNTVSKLAGSTVERISAFMNNRERAVDIVTVAAGRLKNGALLTLNAAGETATPCASYITFFFTGGIVRIDAWGGWREVETAEGIAEREEADIVDNPLKMFADICDGKTDNPSTIQQGLRFAYLWDAVKDSAKQDGVPVSVQSSL